MRTKARTKRKASGKKVINGPALYFLSKSPSSRANGLFSELILKLDLDGGDVEGLYAGGGAGCCFQLKKMKC